MGPIGSAGNFCTAKAFSLLDGKQVAIFGSSRACYFSNVCVATMGLPWIRRWD